MSTLRERYEAQKLHEVAIEARATGHFQRADAAISLISEAKLDPQEAKKIAGAVKRLESLVDKLGGEQGQMPNISKMINTVVNDLNKFSGAGWWTRLLAAMKDSRNPLTKAAAIEGMLKGGMEYVETLLDQQGKKLSDEPIVDQGNVGQNIVTAMTKAFDPGRISSLSGMGGGAVSQLFGTKGSLGSMIANDLSNLKPSQLRAFAKEITAMGTPPPVADTTPQAADAAQGAPQDTGTETGTKSGTQPAAPGDEGPIPVPESTPRPNLDANTLKQKVGPQLANMAIALNRKEQDKALYWAALALQKLGISADDAVKVLAPPKGETKAKAA